MDPLSITASAITLIAAAGSIVTTVNAFTRALRTADTHLIDLTTELTHLTTFLKAVQSSLKGHRAYDLSHFDDSLWQQSEIALSTCQTTLNELNVLVTEIRQGAGKTMLGRRARLAATLTSKAAELQGFRDSIAKSNLALQTILQTITVSLSLRNNASQALVLRGLDDLKASIDRVIARSWNNSNPGRIHEGAVRFYADAQLNRNLRDLAQAARQFHSAASSTATSAATSARSDDEGSSAPWQSYPGADISLFGDFDDALRERVEEYVREAPSVLAVEEPRKRRRMSAVPRGGFLPNYMPATRKKEESEPAEDGEDEGSDEEDDAEFELAIVKGLQELISHHIRAGNYAKAVDFINEAMANSAVSSCDDILRNLQSQLVLTHLLQGQWRLASSLLTTTLARARKDRDGVTCSLLHGLAIAHLTEYAFDDALAVCKMALYGRRRLHKKQGLAVTQVYQTTGLFATIYDMTGDYVRAEVLRGQLPSDFVYRHPRSAISFLLQEETLKALLQGDMEASKGESISVIPGVFELADRPDNPSLGLVRRATNTALMSPLRMRICEHERLERDTTKEVVVVTHSSLLDANDEAAAVTDAAVSPTVAPLRRRLTQIFKPNRHRRQLAVKPIQEDDEDNDSGYGTSSPVENATPTSPWRLRDFSPLKRARTKKLWKRQPLKRETEKFKVLSMERRARVEAPLESVSTPVESPVEGDEPWKPRWNISTELAELDAAMQGRDAEEQSLTGQADQPRQPSAADRGVLWEDAMVSNDSRAAHIAIGTSTTVPPFADGPARLWVPESPSQFRNTWTSIPFLDSRHLTTQSLSSRLNAALSSLSHCMASIPNLKTVEEMDATRDQLYHLHAELRTCGNDRAMERDIEAAAARLRRRSANLHRKKRLAQEEEKRVEWRKTEVDKCTKLESLETTGEQVGISAPRRSLDGPASPQDARTPGAEALVSCSTFLPMARASERDISPQEVLLSRRPSRNAASGGGGLGGSLETELHRPFSDR